MKSIIFLSFVYFVVNNLFNCVNATLVTESDKLEVKVFYETLCPDSMRFVRQQLYPAMKSNGWLPYTDLKFVPYGKVKAWTDPATSVTHLYCQHGERECELNALHACIVEHNTIEEQLELINCLLKSYFTNLDVCSENLKIDVSAAKLCKETRSVSDILKKYGVETDAIDISFVPSIVIDKVFKRSEQQKIIHNFSPVYCSEYKKKFDVTLEKC